MPRRKSDPLLGAVIAKLPAPGSEWPVDQQIGWLHLMAMAFGAVYGGDAAARLKGQPQPTAVPFAPVKTKQMHQFMIDEQGYARDGKGKRVLPKDIGRNPIFDTRGHDGDMKTIIWADDSMGLNGADLVITA